MPTSDSSGAEPSAAGRSRSCRRSRRQQRDDDRRRGDEQRAVRDAGLRQPADEEVLIEALADEAEPDQRRASRAG